MSEAQQQTAKLVDHLFRQQYGKMVSVLTGIFGFDQLEAAEDIVQDILYEAYRRWSYGGVPERPEAWLMQVAKNKALNFLKREQVKRRVQAEIACHEDSSAEIENFFQAADIEDSMLRMIFACCHPAVAPHHQVALVLKSLAGFGSREIARALLLGEDAINKRMYRARRELVKAGVRLTVPTGAELRSRLDTVCTSLYLIFNEGYNSIARDELIRKDMCLEAMRLTKLLLRHFDFSTRVPALLALMCFHAARFDSRLDDKGAIIIFEEQDRSRWDAGLIKAGMFYLSEAARGDRLTDFHLEASIAAQHCLAPDFSHTNWKSINAMYEALYRIKATPVIQLNLAIISARIQGPAYAVERLLQLQEDARLRDYHLLYATLGRFCVQLGRKDEARRHLERALQLTQSAKERSLLQARLDGI